MVMQIFCLVNQRVTGILKNQVRFFGLWTLMGLK